MRMSERCNKDWGQKSVLWKNSQQKWKNKEIEAQLEEKKQKQERVEWVENEWEEGDGD